MSGTPSQREGAGGGRRPRKRSPSAPASSRTEGAPLPLDRFTLYELCAQAPARDVRMLLAIHGGQPTVLGEDFSGAGALSRAWAGLSPRHRAVAVDHDAAALAHARPHRRVGLIRADVMDVRERVDLIAVLNFSICEWHERARLVAYLAHARSRLPATTGKRRSSSSQGGCFICDIYGGSDAFITGTVRQRVRGPRGEQISYSWEQRTADPLSGRVCNAMHFRVSPRARVVKSVNIPDAFVYHWRLWSVPELRDAMLEAGFSRVKVYPRQPDAIDDTGAMHILPVEDAAELGDSFSAYIVGRA